MLNFYTTLLYLAYGLWRGGRGPTALAGPAVAALVGLGIGAMQWIPTVELMAVSTRAVMPFDDAQAGFPLGDVLTPFFPGFIGRSAPLYVGLLPLLLAGGGHRRQPREPGPARGHAPVRRAVAGGLLGGPGALPLSF